MIAFFFEHRDQIVPFVKEKDRYGRFSRIPSPTVAFDDFGAVGNDDDPFVGRFDDHRGIPRAVQSAIVLVTLHVNPFADIIAIHLPHLHFPFL